ncbi:hypothetical protein DDB_G0278273 [Dictyostelium discoideum AX4]|uniref:Pentacotripeptide-repeat region of PRORP domain-containing protein n=1 Tax=Dictyostelium discoideum TaxID=44689 RepID=Q54YE8_DICDI|nr:hypothetical protein DDB_G0278273 [Dictyostelium discoideum AX4]EAL68309.1 hypothetical protein DDB_G0278273 [Dictyostelium discoideum AX4]|eukprot:XP_642254.1 hypothetical protein DDB_G0278273 [Dictyostelium discoideum AX4]
MIRYLLNNKKTIKVITTTKSTTGCNKSIVKYRSFCTSNNNSSNNNNKVEDFYDAEKPETQTFNWFKSKIDKKVTTYVKEESISTVSSSLKEQPNDGKTFEKKFEYYLNLVNDDFLKEELKNASEEIQNNSPIDRSNLSFTTLVRVCGKLSNEESRIKEIIKRLLSLNGINLNKINNNNNEHDSPLNIKFKLSQAHLIMRDYLLRSNSIMVEQVFKFINSNLDRFDVDNDDVDNNNNNNSETYYIFIESLSSNGDISKCLELIKEMEIKQMKIDENRVNRLICIGYSNSNQPEKALEYYNTSSNNDDSENLVILNSILNCFSRQYKIDKMEMVYNDLMISSSSSSSSSQSKDIKLCDYNTIQYLVEGYLKVENVNKAIEILIEKDNQLMMTGVGTPITTQTFHQIFIKLGKQNRLNEMIDLFECLMMKAGKPIVESLPIETDFDKLSEIGDGLVTTDFTPNINTINVLIDSCCQCNNIDMAYDLFNTLIPKFNLQPSSETYSILEAISFKLSRTDLYKKYCVDYFHIIKKED